VLTRRVRALHQVRPIVEAVRDRGDAAVSEYTARFDSVSLPAHVLRVAVRAPGTPLRRGCAEAAAAVRALTRRGRVQDMAEPVLAPEVRAAFDTAFSNISAFHAAQCREPLEVETMPGVRCRRVTRPIGAL
jgi:histidinol dehydrogenase